MIRPEVQFIREPSFIENWPASESPQQLGHYIVTFHLNIIYDINNTLLCSIYLTKRKHKYYALNFKYIHYIHINICSKLWVVRSICWNKRIQNNDCHHLPSFKQALYIILASLIALKSLFVLSSSMPCMFCSTVLLATSHWPQIASELGLLLVCCHRPQANS